MFARQRGLLENERAISEFTLIALHMLHVCFFFGSHNKPIAYAWLNN